MRETSIQGKNSVMSGDVGKIFISISLFFKLSATSQSYVSPRWIWWSPDNYYGFVGYCSKSVSVFYFSTNLASNCLTQYHLVELKHVTMFDYLAPRWISKSFPFCPILEESICHHCLWVGSPAEKWLSLCCESEVVMVPVGRPLHLHVSSKIFLGSFFNLNESWSHN